MLDTIHRVETPEGVDLDLRVAGPPARFLAWLIDFAVRLLVGTGIFFLLLLFGNFGIGVFLLILFLLEWLYPVLFEVLSDGATPGKKALRLLVVHEDGTPVGWEASTLRNLVRAADLVPMFYVSGLVAILFTDSFVSFRQECVKSGDP